MRLYMKKIICILLCGLLLPISAMAQKSFEGAFGQLGAGYERLTPTLTNTSILVRGNNYPQSTSIPGTNAFTAVVSVGYYFAVTPKFLIGLGADWSFVDGKTEYYTMSNPTTGTGGGSYKKTNAYDFYISPAITIGQEGLLYAKFGPATLEKKKPETGKVVGYHGYDLGLGYKQFVAGGFYLFGEANYYIYQSLIQANSYAGPPPNTVTSTQGLSNYNFLAGVGYKF